MRLCAADGVDESFLRRSGAVMADGAWTACVDDDGCDLDALSGWLPRSVGGSAAGDPCGHVLEGHASDLSVSLSPSSWRVLSEVTCLRTGACVECGDEPGGSVAPSWRWTPRTAEVTGELIALRALCRSCQHCSRPERSSWRWPAARRQARLAAIMRVEASVVAASVAEHARALESWSEVPMQLDMSILSGFGLSFRKGWTHEEDVLLWGGGSSRISGVALSTSRGMVTML